MKLKKLLIYAFVISATIALAQEHCAFEREQAKLFAADPQAKQAYLEAEYRLLNTDIQQFLRANRAANSTTVYEIPIVVHLMNDGTTPLRTDAEIITWVNNCNKFYDTTFGGNWLTAANGGTVIPFKLVLAKRSPACSTTTGIVQVNVTATYPQYTTTGLNSSNTNGVTNIQLRALSRWDPQAYYNVYVVNTFDSVPISQTSGLQGYAGFPTNPDSAYDTFMKASVVIDVNDPTTLPHEFGHSMGLHHPFRNGNETTCPTVTSPTAPTLPCNVDNDLVCDTPSTKSLLGVATLPLNGSVNPCDAAGWNNVQYNVMNYTNSNRLFTAGQKDRAVALFLQNRLNLTKSLGGTALSGTPAFVATTTCIPPAAPTNIGDFNFGPTKVAIGTISNTSAGSTNSSSQTLYDYTAVSCLSTAFKTNLAVSANPQTITVRCTTNRNTFSAWIDYNNNGAFDATELIITDQNVVVDTDTPFTFSIPSTGVVLNTPLRLRVIGDSANSSTRPCGQLTYGQVEDYEVTITATPLSDSSFDTFAVNVYPNPVKDFLNVSIANDIDSISIFNLIGQEVITKKGNGQSLNIDLTKLAAGTYIVKTLSNNQMSTSKIIKE